jgi:G protein beta subunit-like protein
MIDIIINMYDLILATAGYDHTIKFWDANSGVCRRSINYPDSQINRLTITPVRKYLGVAAHNVVKVYDIFSHENEVSYEGHTGNIAALGFQKDNKWFFTASEDGTLKIFDFKATGFMRNFNNNGVMVNCAVLHPNQVEIIFGDQSGRIRIWDL